MMKSVKPFETTVIVMLEIPNEQSCFQEQPLPASDTKGNTYFPSLPNWLLLLLIIVLFAVQISIQNNFFSYAMIARKHWRCRPTNLIAKTSLLSS
ncbi:hypothetical protein H3S80_03450 [Bartonella sp. M0177]|uniref:hypothetical protein n=1 Tax=Bartonella sp. M0177 TaxID=2750940 RepID=UPI0018DB46C0|nr:hypothetical protein [Bartonella sp. M0177]MBI0003109.1 hypothetical protein [Bartonella sp. M0177]